MMWHRFQSGPFQNQAGDIDFGLPSRVEKLVPTPDRLNFSWLMAGLIAAGARGLRGLALALILSSILLARNESSVMRWAATAPNCTLRRGDDGRTYYGMSAANLDVVLAVDSRELEKMPHRALPMLALLLTFHLRGPADFQAEPQRFSLEFVKHHGVIKTALAPDAMVADLEQDVEDLTYQVEHHEIKRHPEQKQQKEAELQSRLNDYTNLMDFISTQALQPTVLSLSNPSLNGWVFFGVKDRWIGPWKKPEEFVLRIPAGGSVLEFPFSLPPGSDKVELRRRPER
jgi:hypothetical protein